VSKTTSGRSSGRRPRSTGGIVVQMPAVSENPGAGASRLVS